MRFAKIQENFVTDVFNYLPQDDETYVETNNDSVQSGWGYYKGQFLRPQPPEGWVYIDKVNCFAPASMEERKKLGMRTDI